MSKKILSHTNQLLNVQQAATFLGVNPGTIRRWAQSKEIHGLKVGMRGDWRFTQEHILKMAKTNMREMGTREFMMVQEKTNNSSQTLVPRLDWTQMGESEHFVQFYESDVFLLDSLSRFIGMGIREEDACIVVANKVHRDALEEQLKVYGLYLIAAQIQGRLVILDAAEILSQFMVDGSPDPKRFSETVGNIIANARKEGRRIRVFGEIVALLWADGNYTAAIQLEQLWNDLAKTYSFSLFCAYPMAGFGKEFHGSHFSEIATRHSRLIPAESYCALVNPDERLRAIALLQQKAESLQAEIQERKKLEKQKDEFLGIASHELKTPVTSLKAYTQVLKGKFQKKGDMESVVHLTKMASQINKLTTLISDLLDITKIESGKLQFHEEYFYFDDLVRETIDEIQIIAKNHSIVQKGATKKKICADRDRIGQVLINFLTNAIKYSPDSRTIIVKISARNEDVVFCVQDFGLGIDQTDIPHVFERFYREPGIQHETFPGLGLGLYISSEIIQRHNGKLWVESEKGKGSTFYCSIPIHKKKP